MRDLAVVGLLASVVLVVAAAGIEVILRGTRAPTRLAWLSALVLSAAAVMLTALGVDTRVALPVALPAIVLDGRDALIAMGSSALGADSTAARRIDRVIAAVWIASGIGTLLLFAVAYRRQLRIAARGPRRAIDGEAVAVSRDLGPAVLGLHHPVIVVPDWLLARPASEQGLVIAHEREHIAARDPLVLAIAAACVALMAWNPLLWWAFARLRLAVELDCDSRVLARGIRARDYGQLLLDLSALRSAVRSPLRLGAPALAPAPSQLEQRIRAMTTIPATPSRRRLRLALASAIALVSATLACSGTLNRVAGPEPKAQPSTADIHEVPLHTEPAAKQPPKATTATEDYAEHVVYYDFQVTAPVRPADVRSFPQYPADLRAQGIEGRVMAQFIVDSLGQVVVPSFKVLESTNAGFEHAVRAALEGMRFEPATLKGKHVAQLVQQPFVFQLAR
ncbi:MAG: TonB family protein [Gemmatimonadaceae bacterium]|nr:TonB family protein [Gemmatimonadaceae bacterium]